MSHRWGFLVAILLAGASVQAREPASEEKLDEVEQRGAQVMPFDLEQTRHFFMKTDKDGLQQVVAKESSNTEQLKLIQAHVRRIPRQFSRGNFADPAKIHSDEMPGLADLRAAAPGAIEIEYEKLTNGARTTARRGGSHPSCA
jgi:hypothetical protein